MEPGVGEKLRQLRIQKGHSLRSLSDLSGLNINTLSLIENEKTSPSVATLQRLAHALETPIVDFFDLSVKKDQVVFTHAEQRKSSILDKTRIQPLTTGIAEDGLRAFVLTVPQSEGRCPQMIAHSGYEFIYCLSGELIYHVSGMTYSFQAGDSLAFIGGLDHCWENPNSETPAQFLLIVSNEVLHQETLQKHILANYFKKEKMMKIAVITEDQKSVSQHFGRAPYYLVFTIEEDKITGKECRDKIGHNHFAAQEHGEHAHGEHGADGEGHAKHTQMAETISDCEVLLCGGMGRGAYESMRLLGIRPVVTTETDAESAVKAFVAGTLEDHTEKLH